MSFTIGYTIYNKAHLIEEIVDGVARLEGVESIFLFDACTDSSLKQFAKHSHKLSKYRVYNNPKSDIFEICANNYILTKVKSDHCILFQDDLLITDDSFIRLAEKIYGEDPSAGLIGFKDGYEMDFINHYQEMISSPWSTSRARSKLLNPGEYRVRTYVNRGPLCISRNLIQKIGLFDESFYPIFWDDNDYSLRSRTAGFNNYVAFAEIITDQSWGATRSSTKVPLKDIFIANQIKFAKKWNIPLAPVPLLRSKKAIIRSVLMHLAHRIRSNKWRSQIYTYEI